MMVTLLPLALSAVAGRISSAPLREIRMKMTGKVAGSGLRSGLRGFRGVQASSCPKVTFSPSRVKGVLGTRVGYSGGTTRDPTYQSMGDHTECIQIQYDPSQISYEKILDMVFDEHSSYLHKPYSVQYRSGVWYQDEDQKHAVEKKIEQLKRDNQRAIHTHVAPLGDFYLAEDYHQKYIEKNRRPFSFFG